jgi:hypothetical protein
MLSYHNFLVAKLRKRLDVLVNIKLTQDIRNNHKVAVLDIVDEIQDNKHKSKVRHYLLYKEYKETR